MKKTEARREYLQEVGELSFRVKERRHKRPLKNTLYNYQAPKTICTSYMVLIKAGLTYEQAIEFFRT